MKSKSSKLKSRIKALAAGALPGVAIFALPLPGRAQAFIVSNTVADAFLASGSPGNPAGSNLTANNYGGAGTLAIAPASSSNGEFDSVIMFNTTAAVSAFNAEYGAGNWRITGLSLSLASNTGTQGANPGNSLFNTISGGAFGLDWIADDSWIEGSGTPNSPSSTGVNFNSISTLLATEDSLGFYDYAPPGNGVYETYLLPLDASLTANAAAGGDLSLYFYATNGSTVSYLFNSRSGPAPHPELTIDVTPTPEPAIASLMVFSLGGAVWLGARKKKS